MLFSSYVFVFAFLPISIAAFYILGRLFASDAPQKIFIVLASLFFYGWFNPKYVFILAVSVTVNYILSFRMDRSDHKKIFLAAGIVFNAGLLGWFKYRDFFVENVNFVFKTDIPLRNILLPLGISFFTFQQLSFIVSCYREKKSPPKLIDYLFFVTFFPQLIAGPIVAYSDVSDQLANFRHSPDPENIAKGIFAFSVGLFKKLVVADTLAVFSDNVFSMTERPGFIISLVGILSYTMQIYFDFSGYSDMAVGLGRMFNIILPVNFDLPYRSASVGEFWRRWHITLGRSLATLIYIPLGGNRKGKAATCFNLFVTFLVSGLWHGASWSFVIWGAIHGMAVCAERLFEIKLPRKVGNILTFIFVSGAWTLFRAESLSSALNVWSGLINFGDPGFSSLKAVASDGIVGLPAFASVILILGFLALAFCLAVLPRRSLYDKCSKLVFDKKSVAVAVFAFIAAVICMSRSQVFIYFNF